MTEEENKHGGKRYGSGRKPTGVKRVSFCISCQPEELERLKELVKASGKTMSRFLLDAVGITKQ